MGEDEDGEQPCLFFATHVLEGLPGNHWKGYHCDLHTQSGVLLYDHQGGCVVRAL
jgi:hypothetical protein